MYNIPIPKIFDYKGFVFVIYFEDHAPAHVHVKGHGCEAKVNTESLKVLSNKGFKPKEINIIVRFIRDKRDSFC